MSPTPNPSATASRRQSCDRCHRQKLRCTRAGNHETGACNRCVRQGAQCVYSSSLPKGRPSMHCLAENASIAASKSKFPALPATPTTPKNDPHATSADANATTDPNASKNANASSPNNANPDPNTNPNPNSNLSLNLSTNPNPNPNTKLTMHDDPIMGAPLDTSTYPMWPRLESLNWNDMLVDGAEYDLNQSTAFIDGFPNILDWGDWGGFSGHENGGPSSPNQFHEHGHGFESDLLENSSKAILITEKNEADVGIEQLSRMSTQLYSLLRSSCALAETAAGSLCQSRTHGQSRHTSLIDDNTFKAVAAWLTHLPTSKNMLFQNDRQNPMLHTATTGDTLHDVFAASHHFLDILRCLQVDMASGTTSSLSSTVSSSISASSGGGYMEFWETMTPQSGLAASPSLENPPGLEQSMGQMNYARQTSQCSNTVVLPLVIACYTLLLNIYVAVLTALQHDADRRSFPTAGNFDPDSFIDAAPLADIRLVLVVQLCSYIISRQHQAVEMYLSPQSQPSTPPQHDLYNSFQPNSAAAGNGANREMMGNLEREVQQRLARLRQMLRV